MSHRFATRLLHEAFEPDKATGATTSSICQFFTPRTRKRYGQVLQMILCG